MIGKIRARGNEERMEDNRKGRATPLNLIDGGVGRGTEPESASTRKAKTASSSDTHSFDQPYSPQGIKQEELIR